MSTKRTRKPNNRSSIYRGADGLWHGRVTMGVKNDGSPDRRHRTGKTETEVTEKVRKLEQLRDGGKATKPGRPPKLAEWMATYLDVICENLVSSGQMSPRSLDDYRSKNRNWIEPKLGGHRLDRLLPDHLDVAYSEMYEAGLSSSTVLKIHRIISRALTVAVRRGKIGRNVASREHYGDAPEAVDTEMVPFTQAEARLVLDAAKGRRNAARWSVALSLGLRQGEALGLRWSYVDLETGVVRAWFQVGRANWRHGCDDANACGTIWHRAPCPKICREHRHRGDCAPGCGVRVHGCPRRTCNPRTCTGHARHCPQRHGGGITFRERKGRKKLTIQCPRELLPELRTHREVQELERMAAGEKWTDHDLVFATLTGSPLARDDDWREWKAVLRAAGVRDARLHDARHTAATLLLEQGVHIRVVQEILGHARVTTTERYTHVASPQVRDATERMGTALWG
jgi:integrase